jgi:basic membrane lipoprotein Med (substrate-binding protein (PBP1-ABC) superfamily)
MGLHADAQDGYQQNLRSLAQGGKQEIQLDFLHGFNLTTGIKLSIKNSFHSILWSLYQMALE